MWKTKLGLGVLDLEGMTAEEEIRLFARTGFEAFFTGWSAPEDIVRWKALADELGMTYQSIHAPFNRCNLMWEICEETQDVIDELKLCVRTCAENDIPILVVHTYIGFVNHAPNMEGVENFRQVVLEAQRLGVKIAFENTEGEEYLAALMTWLGGYESVGFCWDTGHEQCYNWGKDMLALYGNKLIATHINDNLGIRDYNGKITWIDDLHLLPFDGIIDWADSVRRMNRCDYQDILTFELGIRSKPGRHENDTYAKMTNEEYVAEVYKRACRIAELKQRMK